jgi:hypothetical protein
MKHSRNKFRLIKLNEGKACRQTLLWHPDDPGSLCQMEIPDVGRVRTGETHPDFHAVKENTRASQ